MIKMYESGIDIQKTFKNKRGYKSSRRSFKIYRLGEEELHLRDAKGDGDIIFEASVNKDVWSSKTSEYITDLITIRLNLTKKEILTYSDGDAYYEEIINQSLRIAKNEGYFDKIPILMNYVFLYKTIKFVPKEPIHSPYYEYPLESIELKIPWLKADYERFINSWKFKQELRDILTTKLNLYCTPYLDLEKNSAKENLMELLKFYKKMLDGKLQYTIKNDRLYVGSKIIEEEQKEELEQPKDKMPLLG